jgi:hypothetical protein
MRSPTFACGRRRPAQDEVVRRHLHDDRLAPRLALWVTTTMVSRPWASRKDVSCRPSPPRQISIGS